MGDWETRASALVESTLGYHPDSTGILTGHHESGDRTLLDGQFDWAVASEKVTDALKGSLRRVGNPSKSAKAEGSLTATPTSGAGTKVGLSDPVVPRGRAIAQRIKATSGITG